MDAGVGWEPTFLRICFRWTSLTKSVEIMITAGATQETTAIVMKHTLIHQPIPGVTMIMKEK